MTRLGVLRYYAPTIFCLDAMQCCCYVIDYMMYEKYYVSTVSVEVSIVDQSGREDTTIIGRRETEQGGGHHRLLLLARIIFWP